jgi:hypothetical protein
MLNRTHTAVLERNVRIDGDFVTEPYELAWADRARWFVHVLASDDSTRVRLQTEMSPTGLVWCPHETSFGEFDASGLFALPVEDPGPYTRLRMTVLKPSISLKAIIYLSMRQ